jgi:uncharacterized membrane protein YfcA
MLWSALVISVFCTSVLSGVLGMAGGMILMAILVTVLSVANAMILHGAVQATANGSRAWFLRRHVKWHLLPNYMLGAAASLALFSALVLVPDAGLVLILVGVFPWLARYSRHFKGLDVTRPLTTISCGFVVTSAQLLAGASGPLLDVFYLKSPLNRHEIVANKALTQTLGHLLKIIYYGLVVGVSTTLPWWLFAVAMGAAVVGTRVGTRLLTRWNDASFTRVSSIIILTIASLCIVRGLWTILS